MVEDPKKEDLDDDNKVVDQLDAFLKEMNAV